MDDFDIGIVAKALGSDTRLKILRILTGASLSSIEVYEIYKKKFGNKKHRESIYRALEMLLHADILDKKYDKDSKKVIYSIKHNKLLLDIVNQKVSAVQ